jgi:Domain of unknown function (DUF4440)
VHEIEALERELQAAVAGRDVDALERLLGQEFTLTTGRPGHEVRGRAEYLEVTATRYVIEEFRFDELEVVELGPGAAVVRSRYVQRGAMPPSGRLAARQPPREPARRERPLTAAPPRIAPSTALTTMTTMSGVSVVPTSQSMGTSSRLESPKAMSRRATATAAIVL